MRSTTGASSPKHSPIPYVKNRLSEERLARVLENPEVIAALEEQIAQSFKTQDFGLLELTDTGVAPVTPARRW